uniref:Uncharacterized protein n=1 Tax=Oryzias melastigma TaxID=30732 RepID=A0A3B3D8N1_ORYME
LVSPVHRLLLSVQRLLQNQLRELVPVCLSLHIKIKIVVFRNGIGAERVRANVGVERVFYGEARPRNGALGYFHGYVRLWEAGWVIIDIHDFDLHAKQLQWVFQKHFQVQLARGGLLTDFFPVNFLLHHQRAVLQVHLQVVRPRVGHRLEAASGKFGDVQPQILSNIPNHGARLLLLWHGVVQLTDSSIQNGEQEY